MLDRLHTIPWSSLECLCGNAGHVPEAIRGLLSDDLQEVEAAYWRLENHVVVQSQLFEAAAYLPEFLFELLDAARYPFAVVNLLFLIGNGKSNDPELQARCHTAVVEGMSQWLAESWRAESDPRLRQAVEDDLRDLRQYAAERE